MITILPSSDSHVRKTGESSRYLTDYTACEYCVYNITIKQYNLLNLLTHGPMFSVATDSCANGHNNCTRTDDGGTCSLVDGGPAFKCGCREGWVMIGKTECKRKLTPQ